MDPQQMDSILRLFTDKYSENLVDRQIAALNLISRKNVNGFSVTDFEFIRDLFDHAFQALGRYGDIFVTPLCALLDAFGKPYKRTRAHEEYVAAPALVDILELLTGVLMWNTAPEIHMAVAKALLSFVEAIGFDDDASGATAAADAAAIAAGGGRAAEPPKTCWDFHQQLLRDRNALGGLTRALRNCVAEYFHDVAMGRTRAEEVMALAVAGTGVGVGATTSVPYASGSMTSNISSSNNNNYNTRQTQHLSSSSRGTRRNKHNNQDDRDASSGDEGQQQQQQRQQYYASSASSSSSSSSSSTGGNGPRRSESPSAAFAATHAVKSAAIVRSPDLLALLARILRECSEDATNALGLTRAGTPRLCVEILMSTSTIRDELAHTTLEILWNLLEFSNTKAKAAAAGSYGDAAPTLIDLLDKHRESNASRVIGTAEDIHVLGNLLRDCLVQGTTQADREFRNDVMVVLTLIADKPESRPYYASTGVLQLLIDAATAAEFAGQGMMSGGGVGGNYSYTLGGGGGGGGNGDDDAEGQFASLPLANFASSTPVDMEFKQLTWALIAELCQGPYADFCVQPLTAPSGSNAFDGDDGGFGSNNNNNNHNNGRNGDGSSSPLLSSPIAASCIGVVRDSRFFASLLMYIDPSTITSDVNAYLRTWSAASRRTLEIHALQILASIGPAFAQQLVDVAALEIIASYVRAHGGARLNNNYNDATTSPRAGGGNGSLLLSSSDSTSSSPNNNGLYAFPVVPKGRSTAELSLMGSGEEGDDSVLMRSSAMSAAKPAGQLLAGKVVSGGGMAAVRGRATTKINGVGGGAPTGKNGTASISPTGRLHSSSSSSAAVSQNKNNHNSEPDVGRQYWALRVLHALCDIDARPDPEAHLSSMLTAGVPTVVAPHSRVEDKVGSGYGAQAADKGRKDTRAAMGHEISAHLGEIGFIEVIVSMLKRLEAERDAGAGSLSPVAGGAGGDGATMTTKKVVSRASSTAAVSSSTADPITSTIAAEGRKRIEPELLIEELLMLVASLTLGAADAAAAKASKLLHHIASLTADETLGGGQQHQEGGLERLAADLESSLREDEHEEEEEDEQQHGGKHQQGEARRHGLKNNHESVGTSYGGGVPPTAVTSTASTDTVHVSLISRVSANQDRLRKCGGVSCLVRYLKYCVAAARERNGGEFSTSASRPRIATAAVHACRAATVGNVRCEARFLADGGVDALIDMVEAAPPTLKPAALTTLADLARNPISHICVRCWKSDLDGHSAGVLLLRLWAQEEKRIGVVHEPQRGVIASLARPLDGEDARARQVAMFTAVHTPTAAAVKDIVPGGRQALAAGYGNTSKGRRSSVIGETTAFRGLRRALRAAKLWQHVESAVPGGPIAPIVGAADLRHKIFAALQSVGFNDVEQQLQEATLLQQTAQEAMAKAVKGLEVGDQDHEADETANFTDSANIKNINNNNNNANTTSEGTSNSGGEQQHTKIVEAFPDLTSAHRVSLELAKAYPEFIVGSAWDDIRTRLAEMKVEPVVDDGITLGTQLDACSQVAERVKALQCIRANAFISGAIESEHSFMTTVLEKKTAEESALKFKEKNKRKPWAASGKTFVGLTMEERKAGQQTRAAMLQRSYLGFTPYPDMPEPTTDEAPQYTEEEMAALAAAGVQ